jgi:hypothetical protein
MSKQNTIVAKRQSEGTIIQRCPMAQPKRCAPLEDRGSDSCAELLEPGSPL